MNQKDLEPMNGCPLCQKKYCNCAMPQTTKHMNPQENKGMDFTDENVIFQSKEPQEEKWIKDKTFPLKINEDTGRFVTVPDKKSNWEEKFDKEFGVKHKGGRYVSDYKDEIDELYKDDFTPEKVKSFIHKTREEAREEGYGEGLIARSVTQIHNDAIQACVEKVDKERKLEHVEITNDDLENNIKIRIFNRALFLIHTSLLSLKK